MPRGRRKPSMKAGKQDFRVTRSQTAEGKKKNKDEVEISDDQHETSSATSSTASEPSPEKKLRKKGVRFGPPKQPKRLNRPSSQASSNVFEDQSDLPSDLEEDVEGGVLRHNHSSANSASQLQTRSTPEASTSENAHPVSGRDLTPQKSKDSLTHQPPKSATVPLTRAQKRKLAKASSKTMPPTDPPRSDSGSTVQGGQSVESGYTSPYGSPTLSGGGTFGVLGLPSQLSSNNLARIPYTKPNAGGVAMDIQQPASAAESSSQANTDSILHSQRRGITTPENLAHDVGSTASGLAYQPGPAYQPTTASPVYGPVTGGPAYEPMTGGSAYEPMTGGSAYEPMTAGPAYRPNEGQAGHQQQRFFGDKALPTWEELMNDPQVIEYLSKKGYSRTEAMLRTESANQDAEGRPIPTRLEDMGGRKYGSAFEVCKRWIDDNLEIYKAELRRILWPLFVYSFLNLVSEYYIQESPRFFEHYKHLFENEHADDLRALAPISLPEHVQQSEIAKIYRGSRYRLTLTNVAFFNLVQFLESREKEGGALIVSIIQTHLQIVTVDRAADASHSLAAMMGRAKNPEDFPGEDEGIPGHNPGSANTDQNAGSSVLVKLKLGQLPLEEELRGDVEAELAEEDAKNPPKPGQNSLSQEFEHMIKREDSEEAPSRLDLPYPPSQMRDVLMEVQKVKENRDRFRIEGRTGGVGAGISVCMFTFHNTFDNITCLDFSQDNLLVAAGMSESYIRVWGLDGKPLESLMPGVQPEISKRLIGHSGSVYAVSFSPSIARTDPAPPSLKPKYLLSSSADKTIRLWHIQTWSCLAIYKGHMREVWDVTWGPFGHYFLSGGGDRIALLYSTEHTSPLRYFVGHDQDVDTVAFHPNGAYVFTGSCDKHVRMWACVNGYPVRLFTGHTGNITSLACSPSGKILASADDAGTIILWDLGPGKLLKRMRGHGKGGIWSLSWSVESTVLISGGADGTVRIWDVAGPADASGQGKVVGEGGTGTKIDGQATNPAVGVSGAGAGSKKKGKEVVVTPDQISAFPTKKSPVYKVKFTRMNLAVAGGAYLP